MSQPSSRLPRGLGALPGAVADAVIANMDLNGLLARVDIDEALEQVDVNRLLDRVDNDRLLEQVDVNRLLDRVDVNRLLDRVDVDRLLERVGIEEIVRRAGIAEIVRESTGQVAGSALDVVRRQIVGLDVILMRVLGGFLREGFGRQGRGGQRVGPALRGPSALVPSEGEGGGDGDRVRATDPALPVQVSGRYAGLLTQVLSFAGDLALSSAIYSALGALVTYIAATVLSVDLSARGAGGPLWLLGLVGWWLVYWWGTLSLQGRTPAMGLLGLRLVTSDAQPLPPRRVLEWVLVLPFSTVLFGAGFLVMLLDRRQRTLQDRVARAALIYDWGNRAALVPSPLGRWIESHDPG